MEIVLAAFASSGLFSLLQFLIKRHDEKKGKTAELDKKIDGIRKDLDDMRAEIKKGDALQARRRILRFNDELLVEIKHTKAMFDDVLEDIDLYTAFCKAHTQDFTNHKAGLAMEHIKNVYLKCEQEASFL